MALTQTTANGQQLAQPGAPSVFALMLQQRAAKAKRRRVVPLRPEVLERGFWMQERLL